MVSVDTLSRDTVPLIYSNAEKLNSLHVDISLIFILCHVYVEI
jgi:hypothetical protein